MADDRTNMILRLLRLNRYQRVPNHTQRNVDGLNKFNLVFGLYTWQAEEALCLVLATLTH